MTNVMSWVTSMFLLGFVWLGCDLDNEQVITPPSSDPVLEMSVVTEPGDSDLLLVAGQSRADLLQLKLVNRSHRLVTVNRLKLTRIGVSGDHTLTNYQLVVGDLKVSALTVIKDSQLNFELEMSALKAKDSVVLTLRADVNHQATGQTIGFSVLESVDLSITDVPVKGNFPLPGSVRKIESLKVGTLVKFRQTEDYPDSSSLADLVEDRSWFLVMENKPFEKVELGNFFDPKIAQSWGYQATDLVSINYDRQIHRLAGYLLPRAGFLFKESGDSLVRVISPEGQARPIHSQAVYDNLYRDQNFELVQVVESLPFELEEGPIIDANSQLPVGTLLFSPSDTWLIVSAEGSRSYFYGRGFELNKFDTSNLPVVNLNYNEIVQYQLDPDITEVLYEWTIPQYVKRQ